MTTAQKPATDIGLTRLTWLEMLKGIALIWIFLNHVTEQMFGSPYIANPTQGWPSLEARIQQLTPLELHGVSGYFLNALRYLGWAGDQGVQLFLIASGFGLTFGLIHRYGSNPLPLGEFYRRRLFRIYPVWIAAHLIALGAMFILGQFALSDPRFLLSVIGLRVTPGSLYYIQPAWWYIGLTIQVYLVFPLLWRLLVNFGWRRFLIVTLAGAFFIRGAGLWVFQDYLDAWSRGALFITRLPEFAFGMGLASMYSVSTLKTEAVFLSVRTVSIAVVLYLLGSVLSLTLAGMTIAPFLSGIGAFLILFPILHSARIAHSPPARVLAWVGKNSYGIFIVHGLFVTALVPSSFTRSISVIILGILGAATLSAIGGLALERGVGLLEKRLRQQLSRFGPKVILVRAAIAAVSLGAILIAGELGTRTSNPQEIFGWGERRSLEPHPVFGWRLKPEFTGRLRWEHYDYIVKANALGFPAPSYPPDKAGGTYRILTTGDAFTSAEGVDTECGWPRLLEDTLRALLPGRSIEVLNFGITGYGPQQYAAVIDSFAPIFRPDLVVVEMFVNDYQDVLSSDDDFRRSIGFGEPSQDGLYAYMTAAHLRRYIQDKIAAPAVARLKGNPSPPFGYFLGNFAAFEVGRKGGWELSQRLVASRIAQIRETIDSLHAKLVIVMVPASIQVCPPDSLKYYPQNVDLSDRTRYDLELPQRMTKNIADSLGVTFVDLRGVLSTAKGSCPYDPDNMHWRLNGHQIVASYLARRWSNRIFLEPH